MSNTPSQSDITQELILFIKKNLIDENISMTSSTPLEQLGLDSFSVIEIVLFIERKFNLVLPDHALTKENVYSVESISKCVWNLLTAK